jgi:hypothetical protein
MRRNGFFSRDRRWARPGRRSLDNDDRWAVELLQQAAARDVADACRHAIQAKAHW